MINIQSIISDLEKQQAGIEKALAPLRGIADSTGGATAVKKRGPVRRRQSRITDEGRRKLALAMKRRWAAKRAKKRAVKKKAV